MTYCSNAMLNEMWYSIITIIGITYWALSFYINPDLYSNPNNLIKNTKTQIKWSVNFLNGKKM